MKGMLDLERNKALSNLCKVLGVEFHDLLPLHQALTHTSFANEAKALTISHNERLEFLGDAVLELVISEYLFHEFIHFSEGELTKARAQVVCEPTLAARANELGLGNYLLLGKGEENSGGRVRNSILADAFEAVIGAIYIDSGFTSAKRFILHNLDYSLQAIARGECFRDYKTMLQEHVQRNGENKISYEVIKESGPDHDKIFEIAVIITGVQHGSGIGKSKKEAEQNAAKQALTKLNIIQDKKPG
jgi:ribonuclease-3